MKDNSFGPLSVGRKLGMSLLLSVIARLRCLGIGLVLTGHISNVDLSFQSRGCMAFFSLV